MTTTLRSVYSLSTTAPSRDMSDEPKKRGSCESDLTAASIGLSARLGRELSVTHRSMDGCPHGGRQGTERTSP